MLPKFPISFCLERWVIRAANNKGLHMSDENKDKLPYNGTVNLVGSLQQFPNGELFVVPMHLTFEHGILVEKKYGPSWPLKPIKEPTTP
jgi:hypothetical protein